MKKRIGSGLLCALAAVVAGCGGGSSTDSTTTTTQPPPPPSATAPSITTQPSSATVNEGQTATFSVAASGTAPLAYQWSKNGAAISGADASSYTTPATSLGDGGAKFVVMVSNTAGNATSNAALLSVTPVPSAATVYDVITFKNDTARTGQYSVESVLNPANVVSATFGLLGLMPVDGKVDAQPLYLGQLPVAGANHNALFVATEHGSIYAFDADTRTILWEVSLLLAGETSSGAFGCDTITPEIGITATPVIDRSAGPNGTIYVVAMSLDSGGNYHQRLHALDVTTGGELLNGPVDISASYVGPSGTTTFNPAEYEDRAALLLTGGVIYTAWSSHCDLPPYGGWIIAFNQASLTQVGALNVGPGSAGNTSSSVGPGIWMSGSGPSVDASGYVYLLTGNGPFETDLNADGYPSGGDFGNSFLKLSLSGGALGVADYFTMSNVTSETAADLDLGSGGQLLLPDLVDSTGVTRHLLVGAGKDGNLYIVNRDDMGKYSADMNGIWQEVDGVLGYGIWGSPAYFNNTLYYGEKRGNLKAFSIANAQVSTSPVSQSSTFFGYPGTSPVVSASGTASAILWAHETANVAVLHAYDATNLANEFYNSSQASGARDQFGPGNTFMVPVVTNGKVFVGTDSAVAEFGLLGGGATPAKVRVAKHHN